MSGPGYRGLQTDTDTGLIYMRHRYYNPLIKQFMSEDPAQAGLNWYQYAGNDPVNRWDPSGLCDDETCPGYDGTWRIGFKCRGNPNHGLWDTFVKGIPGAFSFGLGELPAAVSNAGSDMQHKVAPMLWEERATVARALCFPITGGYEAWSAAGTVAEKGGYVNSGRFVRRIGDNMRGLPNYLLNNAVDVAGGERSASEVGSEMASGVWYGIKTPYRLGSDAVTLLTSNDIREEEFQSGMGMYFQTGNTEYLADLTLEVAPFTVMTRSLLLPKKQNVQYGYRAIDPRYAAATEENGFYRSGSAGRLGNDGLYVSDSIKTAIAEFKFHNPDIEPAVFRVEFDLGKVLDIEPPLGYFDSSLPFTLDAAILRAPSVRDVGGMNYLIRSQTLPAGRIQ